MKTIRWTRVSKLWAAGVKPLQWSHVMVIPLLICGMTGCAPKITSSGSASGLVGQPLSYQIAATRNPTSFGATVPPPTGISVNTASGLISGTPQQDGTFPITLQAKNQFGTGTKQLNLKVEPATAPTLPSHTVVTEKELFIIAPAVLSDSRAQPGGAWHIRSALQRIAGAGQDVEAFAQAWFGTFSNNDSVTGSTESFAKRPWVTSELQQAWQANRIRLIAIVNRIDQTKFPGVDVTQPPVSLGEGRFVYEVLNAANQSLPFTIIFEYKLPIEGNATDSLAKWAKEWHALGRPALGDATQFPAAYLAELQLLTDKFSAHGTLNQIRANEFLEAPADQLHRWELREFHFKDSPARLEQVTVNLTPALANDGQPSLANFISGNQSDLIAGNPVGIPPGLQAAVSPVSSPGFKWTAPGVNARATFITSFNTCSGCHAGDTGTFFQHIGVTAPQMSPFLKGSIPLAEPLPPAVNSSRTHDEMRDRRRILAAFANDAAATPMAVTPGRDLSGLLKARTNRPH